MGVSFGLNVAGESFTVRDGRNGILVFGSVPVDLFPGLTAMAKARLGSKVNLYPGVSWTMEAAMALSTEKRIKAWQRELGIGPDNADWLKSCDCGASSLTIYSVLFDARPGWTLRGNHGAVPLDADDFGRCHRLLLRFPEWRERLGEVVAKYEAWAPIVGRWSKLSELFEAKRFDEVNALLPEAA